jgi:hypothetical protein
MIVRTERRRPVIFIIIPNICSLDDYISYLVKNTHRALRPDNCPCCNHPFPWIHCSYTRKADRENNNFECLNPVHIYRFFCNGCKRTFSILPECIPPRRWYLWAIQQVACSLVIAGHSLRLIAKKLQPSRSTIRRWRTRFREMFNMHLFHLCSRFPELGRSACSMTLFWEACLSQMSLARAMFWINHDKGTIP